MQKFDVLVIGGGPSGLVTSELISKSGITTGLIEKKKVIGLPIQCAGGVTEDFFQNTGIEKKKIIQKRIKGSYILYGDEIYHLSSKSWKGYTLDRYLLDNYLKDYAQDSGVKLYLGEKAEVFRKLNGGWEIITASGEKFFSKFLIGADGTFSKTSQKTLNCPIPSTQDYVKCLQYTGKISKSLNNWYFQFSEKFPQGYCWIFPLKDEFVNVGISISPQNSCEKELSRFMSNMADILEFSKADEITITGGHYPISGINKKNLDNRQNVLLVGDAGGFIDPITGEGIELGILSGIAAGESLIEYFEKDLEKPDFIMHLNSKNFHGQDVISYINQSFKETNHFYNIFSKSNNATIRKEYISKIL